MSERYIVVSDDEYCYTLDTQAENYRSLEDFEKEEFENAKKDNVDIKEYEDAILQSASDKYWEWVYDNHLEPDTVNNIMNTLVDEIKELKQCYNSVLDEMNIIVDENEAFRDKLQDIGVSDFKYGGVRYSTGLCGDLND